MSSSEIIELNSSDEETEKKPKKKKPKLDAMVAIPNQNISGLKIHNVSRPFTPLNNFPRVRATQVGTRILPVKVAPNFCQATKIRPVTPRRINPHLQFAKIINTMSLNGRQVTHTSPKKPTRLNLNPLSIAKMTKNCKNQIKSPNQSKSLNDLPPGITVTRTTGQPKRKIVQRPTLPPSIVIKKKTAVPEITLDDDDDDIAEVSIDSNAQVVPIEFEVPALDSSLNLNNIPISNTINEVNNIKAPETPSKNTNKLCTITEIVIEDSPGKPVVESVAKRLARDEIIIEDSPLKNDSEPENDEDKSDFNSRKKLDFSKESNPSKKEKKENNGSSGVPNDSPVGVNSKPKKEKSSKSDDVKPVENVAKEEPVFNEIYQKFIEACLKVESSDDMKRIVEKKVKAYYREVDRKLTDSNSFVELVSAKIYAMETEPTNSFLHIKDIVDQLSIWRNNQKIVLSAENLDTEKEQAKQRHLRKLERALQKLHRAIQKLEEKEVDFDDDADSVYLLTDRYKARLVRIHDKICELTGTRVPPVLAPLVLQPPPGAARGPTAKLQEWLNKSGKCASVLPFPDFHDVLGCVKEANREDQLGWTESQLEDEARNLFTHCGKILQKRRQELEWRLAASRLPAESDPAECDGNLQAKLQDNEKIAVKREQDVFNTFADRQAQLKLEAEEISDIEVGKTDKSDGSDDDEVIFLDEASQDDEAGTSKESPKLVLDEESKNQTSDKEDTVTETKEDEMMDVNEDIDGKEGKDEDSDSSLKTLSSDSEDIFRGKVRISDSERIDLESEEESSIYSVVSGSSQDDGNSNSASGENFGLDKNASDTDEVIEFLDEESLADNLQDAHQVIQDNEKSANSECSAKVVDLDEESKDDANSTKITNRDRIVRIDSESLDEQIFLNAKKSNVTEKSPLEEIEEVGGIEGKAGSIKTSSVIDVILDDNKTEDSSEIVTEEVSQDKTDSVKINENAVEPVSELSHDIIEKEQIMTAENLPSILETNPLRNRDCNEKSEVTEEVGTTEKNIVVNCEALDSSSNDKCTVKYGENLNSLEILEKRDDELNRELVSADVVMSTSRENDAEIGESENNENITEIEPLPMMLGTDLFDDDPTTAINEQVNSDTENELLNGSQDVEKEKETRDELEKEVVFSQNDSEIEKNYVLKDMNEIVERMDIPETDASCKNDDRVSDTLTGTDFGMEAV